MLVDADHFEYDDGSGEFPALNEEAAGTLKLEVSAEFSFAVEFG